MRSVCLLLAALATACGNSNASDPPRNDSGGINDAAGDAGTDADADPYAPRGEPAEFRCGFSGPGSWVGLDGMLRGESLYGSYATPSVHVLSIAGGPQNVPFGNGGLLVYEAERDPSAGSSVPVLGLFTMPTEGPDPGAWYVAGAASSWSEETTSGRTTTRLALEGVRRIGRCGEAPRVDGSVIGCTQPLSGSSPICAKSTVTSTATGLMLRSDAVPAFYGPELGGSGDFGHAHMRIDDAHEMHLLTRGERIVNGALIMGGPAGRARELFCVAEGTLSVAGGATKFELRAIHRLGAAPTSGGSDKLRVCH